MCGRENVKVIVRGLKCPTCKSPEAHPTDESKVLIRGYKVHDEGMWWSQCLVCAGYYDENLVPLPLNKSEQWAKGDSGWFSEEEEL